MATFTPTQDQLERLARSASILDAKRIPRYPAPLYTSDISAIRLPSAPDAARRALVVWAVALRADGMPQREALKMLDDRRLWPYVSPKEAKYIRNSKPNPEESASLVWRLEVQWVLMWALGRIDDLSWPATMCDVPRLVQVMKPVEADATFIETAQLRPAKEILDAQDLIMRIHWAIRDAWLGKRMIRSDLDWSATPPDVYATQAAAVGVVEQRHLTLNWLTQFGEADWDEVKTHT